MESETILPMDVCSLCEVGIEHYYVITTFGERIVICSDCVLDQFDYLIGIIDSKQRAELIERLRIRIKLIGEQE